MCGGVKLPEPARRTHARYGGRPGLEEGGGAGGTAAHAREGPSVMGALGGGGEGCREMFHQTFLLGVNFLVYKLESKAQTEINTFILSNGHY